MRRGAAAPGEGPAADMGADDSELVLLVEKAVGTEEDKQVLQKLGERELPLA